jgi:putative transposase
MGQDASLLHARRRHTGPARTTARSSPSTSPLRARLAPLRSQHLFPPIRRALLRSARRDPDRFRLLHFSVQHDHVHPLVEASDKRALSRGVRGVAIRIARYVNDRLSRRGSLWGDRWFGRALTSPREVRNALVYVLANHRKHARRAPQLGIDPYSSGAWFDGWATWKPGSERAPPFSQRPTWRNIDCPISTARLACNSRLAPPRIAPTRRITTRVARARPHRLAFPRTASVRLTTLTRRPCAVARVPAGETLACLETAEGHGVIGPMDPELGALFHRILGALVRLESA